MNDCGESGVKIDMMAESLRTLRSLRRHQVARELAKNRGLVDDPKFMAQHPVVSRNLKQPRQRPKVEASMVCGHQVIPLFFVTPGRIRCRVAEDGYGSTRNIH